MGSANERRHYILTSYLFGWAYTQTGIILGMGSANERRRYIVMFSLIVWAYTHNDSLNGINLRACQGET